MSIHVRPATRFADVATMLGPKKSPDASVCWCLSHRVDATTNKSLVGGERGEYVRKLCRRKVPPGVLAYDGDQVAGWAGIAPRADLPVARSTKIRAVDDLPVWNIFCVRVRPGFRGRGISLDLVNGAVDLARSHGAPGVEAIPVDNGSAKVDLTMAFVGTRASSNEPDSRRSPTPTR
jgi:GNAT superfamily N-acetyltransferase